MLVSTSVLTGAAAAAFAEARATYSEGIAPTLNIDFADVRFGSWGKPQDLALSEENRNGYTDLKSQKCLALGQANWRTVLAYSPAEPGLARGLELPDGQVSAGGW